MLIRIMLFLIAIVGCSDDIKTRDIYGERVKNEIDGSVNSGPYLDANINNPNCVIDNDYFVFSSDSTDNTPLVEFGAPPLKSGQGPETAKQCTEASAALPGEPKDPGVTRTCFGGINTKTHHATIERVLESVNDVSLIHVRLTFNPYFVDNSYGDTAIGWNKHSFKNLVGSDHAELLFTDKNGNKTMQLKLDYISKDALQVSGYGSLGVLGGDGKMLFGNPSHVVAASTSLTKNLNFCGYQNYIIDSPESDITYTPNKLAPNWDFRVIYELWIDVKAFGSNGFGNVSIEYVHASPSKLKNNTVIVEEKPCPPDPPTKEPPVSKPPTACTTNDCDPKDECPPGFIPVNSYDGGAVL